MTFYDVVAVLLCAWLGYVGIAWAVDKAKSATSRRHKGESTDMSLPLSDTWYRTLGVSSIATTAEIKTAYQTLINQYRPAQVASFGPELRALAETKVKEIEAAYEYAVSKYGKRYFGQ